MSRITEQTFSQRGNVDGQQAHEKMFNIANHREMQIKMTIRYHLTPVKMAIVKKTKKSVCQDVDKREKECSIDGHVHWYSHMKNSVQFP